MSTTVNGSTGITFPDGTTQNTVSLPGMRNRIINGDFRTDQRNAGASVTPTNTGLTTFYTLDRWGYQSSVASKIAVQQNAGSVTPPAGFKKYLGATVVSAYSVSSTDILNLVQNIEGFNTADLGWGTSSASAITLSFWVRSSLTGTFAVAFYNADASRMYPTTYTISSANTWEQKTVTLAGDTSGMWGATNGTGLSIGFSLGAGSSATSTVNTWSNGFKPGVAGQVNLVGTNGATFYITGVQLEKGSVATPFEYRPYGAELALCQRYYYGQPYVLIPALPWAGTNSYASGAQFSHPVPMRTSPTMTGVGTPSCSSVIGSFPSATTTYQNATYGTITLSSNDLNAFVYNNYSGGVLWAVYASYTASAEL